jgi:tRNA (Thr-GGU) A37 N-methylase
MEYSFKEQTEFTIVTEFLDPPVSNMKDSLRKLQVFSHLVYVVILHKVDDPHP